MSTLREALAASQHEAWTGWMEYLFKCSIENADGTVTIPAQKVERWKRQIATPYADLSDREQDSDRAEADRIIEIVMNTDLHDLMMAAPDEMVQQALRNAGITG